jgi:hypothetical protein
MSLRAGFSGPGNSGMARRLAAGGLETTVLDALEAPGAGRVREKAGG